MVKTMIGKSALISSAFVSDSVGLQFPIWTGDLEKKLNDNRAPMAEAFLNHLNEECKNNRGRTNSWTHGIATVRGGATWEQSMKTADVEFEGAFKDFRYQLSDGYIVVVENVNYGDWTINEWYVEKDGRLAQRLEPIGFPCEKNMDKADVTTDNWLYEYGEGLGVEDYITEEVNIGKSNVSSWTYTQSDGWMQVLGNDEVPWLYGNPWGKTVDSRFTMFSVPCQRCVLMTPYVVAVVIVFFAVLCLFTAALGKLSGQNNTNDEE